MSRSRVDLVVGVLFSRGLSCSLAKTVFWMVVLLSTRGLPHHSKQNWSPASHFLGAKTMPGSDCSPSYTPPQPPPPPLPPPSDNHPFQYETPSAAVSRIAKLIPEWTSEVRQWQAGGLGWRGITVAGRPPPSIPTKPYSSFPPSPRVDSHLKRYHLSFVSLSVDAKGQAVSASLIQRQWECLVH